MITNQSLVTGKGLSSGPSGIGSSSVSTTGNGNVVNPGDTITIKITGATPNAIVTIEKYPKFPAGIPAVVIDTKTANSSGNYTWNYVVPSSDIRPDIGYGRTEFHLLWEIDGWAAGEYIYYVPTTVSPTAEQIAASPFMTPPIFTGVDNTPVVGWSGGYVAAPSPVVVPSTVEVTNNPTPIVPDTSIIPILQTISNAVIPVGTPAIVTNSSVVSGIPNWMFAVGGLVLIGLFMNKGGR